MFQFAISDEQAHDWHGAADVLSESVLRELSAMVNLPDWVPLPHKLRKSRARRTLEEGMRSDHRERRRLGEDRGDMLSALIAAVDVEGDGTGMTDQQLLDECLTLLHAGYDSTAAGMTWCWYLLAQHPDIQQRAIRGSRSRVGPLASKLRGFRAAPLHAANHQRDDTTLSTRLDAHAA